jgi:hypothetical protein
MDKDNNYKLKYLKYKTKYLNLLNQHGGLCEDKNDNSFYCMKKREVDQIINLIKIDCNIQNNEYYNNKLNELNKIKNEANNEEITKYINDNAITILNKKKEDCNNPNLTQLPGGIFIPAIPNIYKKIQT